MMTNWICTDDDCAQHCLKHSDTKYEFVQLCGIDEESVWVQHTIIDLNDYQEENEINEILHSYDYRSKQDLKRIYSKNWHQILAECIFETYAYHFVVSKKMTMNEAVQQIAEITGFRKDELL